MYFDTGLISMGRSRYRVFDDQYPYFITFSVQSRLNLLTRYNGNLIEGSLNYLTDRKKATIHCYVIMPDHVHLIIQADKLPNVMRKLKSYTARVIIDRLQATNQRRILSILKSTKLKGNSTSVYQLWQVGYHPKQITSIDMLEQKMNYIHYNPVKKGLVKNPEEWRYSSAYYDASQSRAL